MRKTLFKSKIIVSKKFYLKANYCRVKSTRNCDTDHHLLFNLHIQKFIIFKLYLLEQGSTYMKHDA